MTTSGPAPAITLRPATPEDLPFLQEMTYEAAFGGQNAAPEEPPPSFADAIQIPWVREYFEGFGREGDFGLIAVDEDGQNIGAAWYRQYSEGTHVEPYELTLAVREEDRRKTIGETLLVKLLEHAGEEGISELGLQVSERNIAARELYKKLGFLTIADKDGYDNYTMLKPINGAAAAGIRKEGHEHAATPQLSPDADVAGYFEAFAPLHDRYAGDAEWTSKAESFIRTALGFKRHGGPVRSVLDLGAGSGISIDAVTKYAEPDQIVAVDVSPGMLEQMAEKRGESALIRPVVAKIEDFLPGSREQFDFIVSMGTFEFVQDLPEVLKHIARHLNQGGIFAATYVAKTSPDQPSQVTVNSPYLRETITRYHWPEKDIEASLSGEGLKIVHRDDSLPAYQIYGEWINHSFVVAEKI